MGFNDLGNCTRCGKLYQKNVKGLCGKCLRDLEEEYDSCVKYLRENKRCTIEELSEGTGVSVRKIMGFIFEGRISTSDNPNLAYPCEVCDTPISGGKMCDSCRIKLAKQAKTALETPTKSPSTYQSVYKVKE